MRLCLNTSTIKPQPLLEKIRLAAAAGFAGIELWINDIYEYVGHGGEVRDVEKALADHGLVVPCMIAMRGWGDASSLEFPIQLDEAKRRMALAARFHANHVVATPPRDPCDRIQIGERYCQLLELGKKMGVRPTLEYISFFHSLSSLSDAWSIVKQIEDSEATLILDAFHTWNTGEKLTDFSDLPIERISHYHIDDADSDKPARTQTDPDRQMIGDGPIDLLAELKWLKDRGYDGWISLELFNATLWDKNPKEVLQTGMERLQRLLLSVKA